MHGQRRGALQGWRRATAAGTFAAVLIVGAFVPTLASANPVDDLLNQLGVGNGNGAGAAGSGVSPSAPANSRAGVPPSYTPPLHGTNPHGQGTVGSVDIQPSNENPYPSEPPSQNGEEVVIGDSRGEQGSSGYNGKVTLLYLFGQPIVQVTSSPGQSNDGPFQPLQDGLDQLCDGSGGQLCLTFLSMHSSTDGNGSTNSFQAAGADIGGEGGIHTDFASSHGNISNDSSCQTAHGDSSVIGASAGGQPIADVMHGSSTSTDCNDGSHSVDNQSTVLGLGGQRVPFPTQDCANGTPNTNFTAFAPLFALVCGADDTNGSQASTPYGVREALTLFFLITDDTAAIRGAGATAAIKGTGAGAESHAVAPPKASSSPPGTPPGGGTQGASGGGGANGGGAKGGSGGNGPAAGQPAAGNGVLAFTGADLLALGLTGGALILGGLALSPRARNRETA
jgi:hypothetical protein